MKRHAVLVALVLASCTGRTATGEADGAGTNEAGSTTGLASDATSTMSGSTSGADEDDGRTSTEGGDSVDPCPGGFVACVDQPPPLEQCDFWAQDCPDGEKCVPFLSSPASGVWDAHVCVPMVREPVRSGEPCEYVPIEGHTVSAIDTCDGISICLDLFSEALECTEMCTGTPSMPGCATDWKLCRLNGDGILNLCTGGCDPRLPGECPTGLSCVAQFSNQERRGFACLPPGTSIPGGNGDSCECANCCAPGHECAPASVVGPDCTGASCCTPYCDLAEPGSECASGQRCVALFPPDHPVHADVGRCEVAP